MTRILLELFSRAVHPEVVDDRTHRAKARCYCSIRPCRMTYCRMTYCKPTTSGCTASRGALRAVATAGFIWASALVVQASTPLNEALTLSRDSATDSFSLSWWGTDEDTYFIQFSPDLTSGWNYVPLIEQGFDDEIAWGFYLAGEPGRAFFRLRFTDLPAPDPYSAVFGGDGIPSGWKLENGLDPFADYTGLSPDGSALTYWELWQLSLEGGNDPAEANVAGLIVYSP